jgi:dinuclear metal center YbgI/SA1388 family protein
MTKIREVAAHLNQFAPLALQESYDNAGLLVGDPAADVTGILISLDCTEEVIAEAEKRDCNLIVSHHPIIFKGLKKLTGSHYVERTVLLAIRKGIALYAAHTNLDNVPHGVNRKLAEKIGLQNLKILAQRQDSLLKLVTFTPTENREAVLKAMHEAGAGNIGNYEECSWRVEGTGRFRPNDEADPHIGESGKREEVQEEKLELIFPFYLKEKVVDALRAAHPYEEVAYYLTALQNANQEAGAGMVGELDKPMAESEFIELLKKSFGLKMLRHTAFTGKEIRSVAVCGGAGSFLIGKAFEKKADAFVTADLKYHEFFEADGKLLLADIGHYESEVATGEIFLQTLTKKFGTFAVVLSETVTNPVLYS